LKSAQCDGWHTIITKAYFHYKRAANVECCSFDLHFANDLISVSECLYTFFGITMHYFVECYV
jgi:hypothetical protein